MLTQADKALRKGRITASIGADVLGLGAFGTPLTAWMAIHDMPREDIGERDEVQFGVYCEDGIAKWWEARVGIPNGLRLEPGIPSTLIHPEFDFIAATPDRFVLDAHGRRVAVLQVKTAGHFRLSQWMDFDSREITVPDGVVIQVQTEMAVTGMPRAYIAATVDNKPFFTHVDRDQPMIDDLVRAYRAWHKRHVIDGEQPMPTGRESDSKALRWLHPDDDGTIMLLPESVADCARISERMREEIAAQSEERERLRNVVKAAMGRTTFAEAQGIRVSYKTARDGDRSLRITSF